VIVVIVTAAFVHTCYCSSLFVVFIAIQVTSGITASKIFSESYRAARFVL